MNFIQEAEYCRRRSRKRNDFSSKEKVHSVACKGTGGHLRELGLEDSG